MGRSHSAAAAQPPGTVILCEERVITTWAELGRLR